MEWILLLLLGGLAAGTAFWAAGGKEEDDLPRGPGPRSSPDLPEAGRADEGQNRGKPVVIGDRRSGKEEAARAIRQAFENVPE